MESKLRRIVDAEIRRAMAGSALQYPRLNQSKGLIPGLTQEAGRLVHEVVERVLADPIVWEVVEEHHKGREQSFVDSVTGLDLLPEVKPLYRDREDRTQSPEEFLRTSGWGPLAANHLIYAEHLRRADPHLYYALCYRAYSGGAKLADYFFPRGIFSKACLAKPPNGYERQAELIRALRMHLRSQTLRGTAVRTFTTTR